MPFAGDLMEYFPGNRVPVEVVADAGGEVATRRDGVEITGETDEHTQVRKGVTNPGDEIGYLAEDPDGYTGSDADYAAGDVVGTATLVLLKPVAVLDLAGSYDPTAGDLVTFNADGKVIQQAGLTASGIGGAVTHNLGIDANGNLETDNAADIDVSLRTGLPFGQVFSTIGDGFEQANRVMVAVNR